MNIPNQRTVITVAVCALVVLLIVQSWNTIAGFMGSFLHACTPIIVAFAFAFAANIPMTWIEERLFPHSTDPRIQGLRRPIAVVLTIAASILAGVALVLIVIPQFASALVLLNEHIPEYIEMLKGTIGSNVFDSVQSFLFPAGDSGSGIVAPDGSIDAKGAIDMLQNSGGFIGGIASGVMDFASSIVSLVLSATMSIALLFEKDTFRIFGLKCLHAYLSEENARKALYVLDVFNRSFRGFIAKQLADATIIGVLTVLAMMILGLPYAHAVGTLVGLSALIPMIGVWIGLALGALLVFAVSPLGALVFAVVCFLIIQIEASFISPNIVMKQMGMPGVWILIAITVFGALWGIPGVLVGVPIFAALYTLLQNDINRRKLPESIGGEAAAQ